MQRDSREIETMYHMAIIRAIGELNAAKAAIYDENKAKTVVPKINEAIETLEGWCL